MPENPPDQLKAHRDVWGQRELLRNIVARYFIVTGELGGTKWPVWKVDEIESTDINESLEMLNQHLDNLGWMAKLQIGDPWLIQIIPYPERQFPSIKTTVGFWSFSLITATIAGMLWIEDARPNGGWIVEPLFFDALFGYTLPIFGIIILASFLQKRHAEQSGLRVGHLTPIPDPSIALFSIGFLPKSILIWPFGILIIPSLPRMDARPWKDREILGWSALIVPSVMILAGLCLWLTGLFLTPDLVVVTSMQYVPEMPLFVNLISPLVTDGISSKLVWAHPLSKAGSMLCFFGWVSLLPIPTFPGGRLLIARTSMAEARNSTNQLFLFAIVLAFAWMFNAFTSFNIWLPVLGIMFPLLLMMGADRRIPVILNEPKGVEYESIRRMGVMLFVIFLLGLPGQTPYSMDEDWQDEVSYIYDDTIQIIEINESWIGNMTVIIENTASVTQHWEVHLASSNGLVSQNWEFNWTCSDDDRDSETDQGCGDEILPNMASIINLNVTWKSHQFSPLKEQIYLITYIDDEPTSSVITLTPEIPQYLNNSWYMNYQSDDVMRCIGVYSNTGTTYNISFPNADSDFDFETRMYWIDGYQGLEAEIESGISEICIKGQDPIVLLRAHTLNIIKIGNNTFSPELPTLPMHFITPKNGTLIDSTSVRGWGSEIMPGDILSMSESTCQLNPMVSTPTQPTNKTEQWIWNTDYRTSSKIPAIQANDSVLLIMSEPNYFSICSENAYPIPKHIISIENGPELIFERNNQHVRMWTTMWAAAANGELSGDNMSEFVIHNPQNATTKVNIVQTTLGSNAQEWTVLESLTQLDPGENNFKFQPPNNLLATMYIEYEDGELYIYLGSYS